ncbi:MAG: hypothetical protein ABI921_07085 [Panacibacter sp.]
MQTKWKKISLVVMSSFYMLAGVNHIFNPGFYLPLIPPYLPAHEAINTAAGIAEIGGSVLICFTATRNFAARGIILMLIAFMPVHIYMVQHTPMQIGSRTITPFIAWLRIPIQALLIWWAWSFTGTKEG